MLSNETNKPASQPMHHQDDEWMSVYDGKVRAFVEDGGFYTDRGVHMPTDRYGGADNQRNVKDLVHEELLVIAGKLEPLIEGDNTGEGLYLDIKQRRHWVQRRDFEKDLAHVEKLGVEQITHQEKAFIKSARDFATALVDQDGLVHVEEPVSISWARATKDAAFRNLTTAAVAIRAGVSRIHSAARHIP